MSENKPNTITLSNGLTLVLQPVTTPIGKTNITFVFDGVGSISDTKPGIAHLAEHMVFRGTDSLTAKAVVDKITNLSNGSYTAYTAYDKTVFSVDTYKNHLSDAVTLLVDMFTKSSLGNFETEKKVVGHELNLRLDNPYINLFNLIDQSHGLHNDEVCQKSTLPLISQTDVQSFIKQNYMPSKCALIISGEMDDLDIVKVTIQSKTKHWTDSNASKNEWNHLNYKPGYFAEAGPNKCSYFSLFFKGANKGNINDIVKQSIVNAITGYGMSSILMYDARINKGLTYGIDTFDIIEKDHGIWGVAGATDKESLKNLIESAMTSVKAISRSLSPENGNIDIAKITLKNSINQPILSPARATSDYMMYSQLGVTKDQLIKIIDETTTQDVLDWFNKTTSSAPSLALYGDINPCDYSQDIVNSMWNSIGVVA